MITRIGVHGTVLTVDSTLGGPIRVALALLRDRCPCPSCQHPAGPHLLNAGDNLGVEVAEANLADGGCEILWQDGRSQRHLSTFSEQDVLRISGDARGEMHVRPFTIDALDWSADPATLNEIRSNVLEAGVALIRKAPVKPGTAATIASRLGSLRTTEFGMYWEIRSERVDHDLGHWELPVHTDDPYRSPRPGVQVLHCLRPAKSGGGVTTLVDGWAVADALAAASPEDFRLLREVPVTYRYRDANRAMTGVGPVFEKVGPRVQSVRFNRRSMVTPVGAPELLASWYGSFGRLCRQVDSAQWRTMVDLDVGDALVLDNHRVLHGRTAFRPLTDDRHLQAAYLDKDSIQRSLRS